MGDSIRKMLAAFAILAAVLLGAPAPAQAAASDCPDARMCTWQHVSYGGTMWVWDVNVIGQQPGGCLTVTASAKNTFTSLYNRVGLVGTTKLYAYAGSGCTGFYQRIYSGTIDPNLDQDAPIIGLHDTIESFKVTY